MESLILGVVYAFRMSGEMFRWIVDILEGDKIHLILIPLSYALQQIIAFWVAIGYIRENKRKRLARGFALFVVQFALIGLFMWNAYYGIDWTFTGYSLRILLWFYYLPTFAITLGLIINLADYIKKKVRTGGHKKN